MENLKNKKCQACEGKIAPLNPEEIQKLIQQIKDWKLDAGGKTISRTFHFKNYFHTMAFVNAVAWVAHQENHHPDLKVGFNQCDVQLVTHAVNGLTENDFILAAKIESLL